MNDPTPQLLVHWTNRSLARRPLCKDVREEYLRILRSFYRDGVRFTSPTRAEFVRGVYVSTALPTLPIICFTEIRLSQVARHSAEYGQLGIGFSRDYLMAMGANPVFYVQNANQGIVNTNLSRLADAAPHVDGLDVIMAYMKPMGEYTDGGDPDVCYYREREWRIVGCKYCGGRTPFEYRDAHFWLKFERSAIELLVFPDEETRKMALNDAELLEHFGVHMPMMVDADRCSSF